MTPEEFIERTQRRRHGDTITESATVACPECGDYEVTYRYHGDPDAGGIGMAVPDDTDLTTCPVCGGETEVTVE